MPSNLNCLFPFPTTLHFSFPTRLQYNPEQLHVASGICLAFWNFCTRSEHAGFAPNLHLCHQPNVYSVNIDLYELQWIIIVIQFINIKHCLMTTKTLQYLLPMIVIISTAMALEKASTVQKWNLVKSQSTCDKCGHLTNFQFLCNFLQPLFFVLKYVV